MQGPAGTDHLQVVENIPRMGGQDRDRFRRVEGAASTHPDNDFGLLLVCQPRPLPDQLDRRLGRDAQDRDRQSGCAKLIEPFRVALWIAPDDDQRTPTILVGYPLFVQSPRP